MSRPSPKVVTLATGALEQPADAQVGDGGDRGRTLPVSHPRIVGEAEGTIARAVASMTARVTKRRGLPRKVRRDGLRA